MPLPGPEPAKSAGGQQRVDQAVESFLEGHAPRQALPDAVDQGTQGVNKERGGASNAKHGPIGRARRHCMSREIRDEEADEEEKGKPQAQELRHGDWAAGKYG